MTTASIFALQFLCVLALGLQSLNVNGGHRLLAAITSVVISITSLGGTYFTLIYTDPSALNVTAFIAGSVCGILTSMRIHPWLVERFGKKQVAA